MADFTVASLSFLRPCPSHTHALINMCFAGLSPHNTKFPGTMVTSLSRQDLSQIAGVSGVFSPRPLEVQSLLAPYLRPAKIPLQPVKSLPEPSPITLPTDRWSLDNLDFGPTNTRTFEIFTEYSLDSLDFGPTTHKRFEV